MSTRTTRRTASHQPASTSNDYTIPEPPSAPATPTSRAAHPPRRPVSPVQPGALFLNVRSVLLGRQLIEPWFPSLYREELVTGEPVDRLWVCERCFRYSKEAVLGLAHRRYCVLDQLVPGRLVYDGGRYSIYEVDGEEHQLFTQNLSLFAKLFIENKSVCFDVSTFLYYLLVDNHSPSLEPIANGSNDSPQGKKNKTKTKKQQQSKEPVRSPQIVGFFSKEKLSWDNNNLACILVFPPWQKLGLGQMLMAASYELARRERRLGGPERPLSVPGKKSYFKYWSRSISTYLLSVSNKSRISISDISEATYMIPEDIVATLVEMSVLGSTYKSKTGQERIRLDKSTLRLWLAQRGIESGDLLDVEAFVDDEEGDEEEEANGEDETAEAAEDDEV